MIRLLNHFYLFKGMKTWIPMCLHCTSLKTHHHLWKHQAALNLVNISVKYTTLVSELNFHPLLEKSVHQILEDYWCLSPTYISTTSLPLIISFCGLYL